MTNSTRADVNSKIEGPKGFFLTEIAYVSTMVTWVYYRLYIFPTRMVRLRVTVPRNLSIIFLHARLLVVYVDFEYIFVNLRSRVVIISFPSTTSCPHRPQIIPSAVYGCWSHRGYVHRTFRHFGGLFLLGLCEVRFFRHKDPSCPVRFAKARLGDHWSETVWDPGCGDMPFFKIANFSLLLLQAMHVWWFLLLGRIGWRILSDGGANDGTCV